MLVDGRLLRGNIRDRWGTVAKLIEQILDEDRCLLGEVRVEETDPIWTAIKCWEGVLLYSLTWALMDPGSFQEMLSLLGRYINLMIIWQRLCQSPSVSEILKNTREPKGSWKSVGSRACRLAPVWMSLGHPKASLWTDQRFSSCPSVSGIA